MIEFDQIKNYLKKPRLFEKSTASLWDDEHISKGMLAAHLHPHIEAASRKHEFIDRSAHWIYTFSGLKKGANVLDLGCGPGLYAERLAKLGLNLTGIDYSKRSIAYAKTQAQKSNLAIDYIYQNYMDMDYNNAFDLVIMIYCDFGVLSYSERDLLLEKVNRSLKVGGRFVFDVSTLEVISQATEKKTWSFSSSGYWRPYPYICFESVYFYPGHPVLLTQYTVIDKKEKNAVYRIWDCTYSKESIKEVLQEKGFEVVHFCSDLTGRAAGDGSDTLGVVSVKRT